MTNFKEITPQEEWVYSPFDRLHKDWALIGAAKKDGSLNMMTISWGGVGIMWRKPVVYLVIRPQRYTKEFVDAADTLSLSFFSEEYREQLSLCGKKSGRDIDKVKECGFTVELDSGAPVFQQADTVLICRKLFSQPMLPESILCEELKTEIYPEKDYHQIYIAEILKAFVRK